MAYNPLAFGLMLVATGALMFAAFLYHRYKVGIDPRQEKTYGGIFILLGIIASMFGYGMFLNEPIPGHYIEIYGVGYLIFTFLMLIGGLCMVFDWDKIPASYLALVGGAILMNSAFAVIKFSLSKSPLATALLFGLAGIGSMGTVLLTHLDIKDKYHWFLMVIIAVFLAFGLLALYSGMTAQLGHVESAVTGL